MQNESINEGPAPGREASPAAAVPIVAKIPAPMIAPIPSKVTLSGPRLRLRERVSSPSAARMSSRFFVRKIPRSKMSPPEWILDSLTWLLPPGLKECLRSLAWKTEKGKEEDRSLAFGLWSLYAWDLGLWFFHLSVSKDLAPDKSKDKQRPKSQDLRPT